VTERSYERWIGLAIDYTLAVEELKNYLYNSLTWMDGQISDFTLR
jgi:hypothetical protein